MFKTRFISMLVLLMTAVTGAVAQEVTLLTTIENTGDNASFTSGSKTFDDKVTVTFSGNVYNEDDDWGWYSEEERTLTVTAAEGYTITRVRFYNSSGSAFDEDAPFEAILVDDYNGRYVTKVNGTSLGDAGVTKIEVYGYAGAPEPATVAVTGVTLAPTTATLTLGETETVTLIPTVLPAEATDKSVTWSSSDEAVATVTDGVVTAVAAGTATITVTTTDGAKTATCAVTVAAPAASTYTVTLKEGTEDATSWTIAPAEATTTGVEAGTEVKATYGGAKKVKSVKAVKKAAVPVTAITLNKTETSIKVGATETLSVTAVAPDNATDKTYTWKTSDETKATVDQDGKVTAVAAGTVTIYAEANDGSGVKGNCTVTVTPATITVTWNNNDITSASETSFTKDGVTITAGIIDFNEKNFMGGGTFTTTRGNFTKIEVTTSNWAASGTGWSGSTWTGNASSVSFDGDIYGEGMGNTMFVFTIEPTN